MKLLLICFFLLHGSILPCPHALSPGSAFAGEPPPSVSLRDMAAQMIMVGFRGAEADGESVIAGQISGGYTANVILFDVDVSGGDPGRNIHSPEQLSALISSLKKQAPPSSGRLWVAIDQEGGMVQRLKPERGFAARYPSAKELGKDTIDAVRQTAEALGQELRDYGFDLDFAPVADLDINPDSPAIGKKQRSFSPDPGIVSDCVTAYGEGLANAGIVPCLKHFPGHGSADSDTHIGVTDVTTT